MRRAQVAKRIRFYVKRTGLSRSDLAAKLGVTEQAVYQWWTGKKNQPTLMNLARIARLCGVTLPEFLGPCPTRAKAIDDEAPVDDSAVEEASDLKSAAAGE